MQKLKMLQNYSIRKKYYKPKNKIIIKLTDGTFAYFKCETEQEQGDMMALCELLGLDNHCGIVYEFSLCNWILISGDCKSFQQTVGGFGSEKYDFAASDFIKSNF